MFLNRKGAIQATPRPLQRPVRTAAPAPRSDGSNARAMHKITRPAGEGHPYPRQKRYICTITEKAYDMKEVMDFLARLQANNNREWFKAHKDEYQAAQARFDALTARLIEGLGRLDPTVGGLDVKSCTYRIYRDTRFTNDKSPYKTHMGAFVCPGGKKSGFGGYYFQVGPDEAGYPSGNMLAVGHYCFTPRVMRLLREDICADNGELARIVERAAPFVLDDENRLKRVPNGFPRDVPFAPLLTYRTFCLAYSQGRAFMLAPDVVERTLDLLARTQPFLAYVNRAVAYDREAGAAPAD